MARIRSIKPAFWESEKIAKRLPGPDGRQARLLFIALWNNAEDATGVSRGSAAYLRSAVFPYDDDVTTKDVERWLGMLERGRFIIRFEREDQSYLWVRGFKEHQRIDHPAKPNLPEPSSDEIERALSQSSGGLAASSRGNHEDSRGIHEDSEQTPQGGGGGGGEEVEREVEGDTGVLSAVADAHPPPAALQDLWNKNAHPSLPRWDEMPDDRRRRARKGLKERSMLSWLAVIQRINKSSFCLGEKGWAASPDWLVQPGVAAKVLEGKYDNRSTGPPRDVRKGIVRAEDMNHDLNEVDANGNIRF